MDGVKEYLFSVLSTVFCCSIVAAIVGKRGTVGNLVKFLCGIVIILTLFSPISNVKLGVLVDSIEDISVSVDTVAQQGKESALLEYRKIIKPKTEAYILDKAKVLGAELLVEVTLSDDVPPIPCAVNIQGPVAPYVKKILAETLVQDLGIETEDQTWIG